MIFKTIEDETTISGQRIVGALEARKIAQQQATAQLEVDIACLKQYEIACRNGSVSTERFDSIMQKASITAKGYTANIKAGTGSARAYAQEQRASNTALKSVGVGATVATGAVTALRVAMNSIGIGLLIAGLSKLAEVIYNEVNNSIHKFENYIKEADELLDDFKSDIDNISSSKETIKELTDDFNKLSKGVDENGRNISLTAEEYSKYQNILSTIAGINPNIIKGYDEENNILADKNTILETTNQLLKDEYNQKLKNLALPDNVETTINGAVGRYKTAKDELEKSIDNLPNNLTNNTFGHIDSNGNVKYGYADFGLANIFEDIIGVDFDYKKQSQADYIYENIDAILNNMDKIKERASQTKDGIQALSEVQLISLMDYLKEINILYGDLNNASTSANSTLQYVAMAEDSYNQLTDKQKIFISDYINGIKVTEDMTEQEKEAIRRSIISITQELAKHPEISQLFEDLYSLSSEDVPVDEYIHQYKQLVEDIIRELDGEDGTGLTQEQEIDIRANFNINEEESRINTMKEDLKTKLQDEFDNKVGELTLDELEIAANLTIDPEETKRNIVSELKSLEQGGSVNLTLRPQVDTSELNVKGWDAGEGTATVYSSTYSNEDGTVAVNFTPIIADPKTGEYLGVLSPDELQEYAEGVIAGTRKDDLNLQIGAKFEGKDAIQQAEDSAIKVHELHERYFVDGDILLLWDELIARIEESKETLKSDTSFSSIFNSSDFSDTKQSLLELAKSGQLTNKALSSDDYSDFIDKLGEIGISAEEARKKILSMRDSINKLSGASQTISSLEDAYTEFQEKGYVLAETIESIPDVFRELETYDFDVFESIIGNPKANNDEIQNAFNDLVTAYISEMAVLSDVSESESQQFIANLKEMGVVNAEEVVNSVLALNDSMEATAKEAESTAQEINYFLVNVKGKAASATNDLTNCTWSEIQALIEEGNRFGFTTNKIEEFAMKKIWANRNSINTSDDIAQLLAVAKAAGFAATSISAYEYAVEMQKHGNGGGEAWVKSMQESAWRDVLREIEESFNFTPTVSYKAPTTNSSSSSSSSSSKEAEKTAETYDWIEKLLERIQSRIDKLDKTASSTYRAWSTRNKALLDELKEVNGEIKAQQKAYDVYMAKANSVGLSEHYKQLVQNGDYKIEDITDDTLKDQISSYEEWCKLRHTIR